MGRVLIAEAYADYWVGKDVAHSGVRSDASEVTDVPEKMMFVLIWKDY